MFGIGTSELFVLVVAGLFILGPERLPSAAVWTARTLKQVREYATGAREQFKDDLGPEFEELRKPLADLQKLRGFNPRTAITQHLLDGDDSFLFGPKTLAADVGDTVNDLKTGSDTPSTPATPNFTKASATPPTGAVPMGDGERLPFDEDAT